MVINAETITERLKYLDTILQELDKHEDVDLVELESNLSQRWVLERGLISSAAIIFDIADHILASHFGQYTHTYEDSLSGLQSQGVLSEDLYRQLKGLGGLRNILVHRYLDIDADEIYSHFHKGLYIFPQFAQEILAWLDGLNEG